MLMLWVVSELQMMILLFVYLLLPARITLISLRESGCLLRTPTLAIPLKGLELSGKSIAEIILYIEMPS